MYNALCACCKVMLLTDYTVAQFIARATRPDDSPLFPSCVWTCQMSLHSSPSSPFCVAIKSAHFTIVIFFCIWWLDKGLYGAHKNCVCGSRATATSPQHQRRLPCRHRDDGTHFRQNEEVTNSSSIQINWMIRISIDISFSWGTVLFPLQRCQISSSCLFEKCTFHE